MKKYKTLFVFKKAFSLVEVVISIGILSIGLLAVSTLFSNNVKEMFEIRDQTTAVALAQEGIEFVRNYHSNPTNSPLSLPSNGDYIFYGKDSYIQKKDFTLDKATFNYVFTNGDLGLFTQRDDLGGEVTKFKRKISISDSGTSKTVKSYVIWGETFPASDSNCNAANKCVYSKVELY
ncbi:MAG: prepilin-type N-terminal cleavage/methylation domain-containing protein [Candidatus Moraniibacteriota bacterium]|nr:MAG: prepilin-type N-terminal cleavage/methylation domain-containing protein [Candidatus Moranbacteria bacterium]